MTEPFEPIDTLAGPGEAKTNAQTLARLVSEAFPEAVTEDGIDFITYYPRDLESLIVPV